VKQYTSDPLIRATAEARPPRVDADNHKQTVGVPGLQAEKTQSWGLISADVISRAAGEVSWLSDEYRICLALTDLPGTAYSEIGAARPLPLMRGMLGFTPAGLSTRIVQPAGRFIQIRQRPETYDTIIAENVRGGTVDLEHRSPIGDPLLSQIASTIAHELEGGFLDRILVDALNTALAAQIVRQFVDPSKITLAPSNGLSRERLQRVCDYIEAHLDDRLSLADLARVACLSPYHFSRSFKQAVGVGVQRYVMQRRIERAKTLMRRTNQPLALIAQEAGFTDQSHLTSIFRRETGETPGRYRAALA
jgi:AraC family transcriptional regulator